MVSEEHRFSKVDVKGRQQLFENMANQKEPPPPKNNRSMTRSHSTETQKVKSLVSLRNARSVSTEPSNRRNEGQGRGRDMSQRKSVGRRLDWGGAVDEKIDKESGKKDKELTPKINGSKEVDNDIQNNRTPEKKQFLENVSRKNANNARDRSPIDNKTGAIKERIPDLVERDSKKEAKSPTSRSERENVKNRVKALEGRHSDHAEMGSSKTNLSASDCGKISKDENVVQTLDLKPGDSKKHSEEPILPRLFRRSIEIKATSRKKSSSGDEKSVNVSRGEEKERETLKESRKQDTFHELSMTKEKDGGPEDTAEAQALASPVNEQLSSRNPVRPIERKPSVKIVVTGKSIENPVPKRKATIVRVNSNVSDKNTKVSRVDRSESLEPAVNTRQDRKESLRNRDEGDCSERVNDGEAKGDLKTMQEINRQQRASTDDEDGSSYYRDVRCGLRGRKASPAAKQDLLTELLSLENTEKAKSLGLSDELIELLREEEGFWKRQVELKKWRESKETRPTDADNDRVFDAAKERRIAQLRKEHTKNRHRDPRYVSEELMVEELKEAEDRLRAQELIKSLGDVRIPHTTPELMEHPESTPFSPNENETVIFLKQSAFSSEPALSLQPQKGNKRSSYPPISKSEFSDSWNSLDRLHNREHRSVSHDSSGSISRTAQSVSSDLNQVPRLSSVSSGPITYYEHMARVLRDSLVAEPYASHPQRNSTEPSPPSQKPPNAGPGGHSKQESFESAGYSAVGELPGSDYQKKELATMRLSPFDESFSHNRLDSCEDPFSPATGAFDFNSGKVLGDSQHHQDNLLENLKSNKTYCDPSYFSLIENHSFESQSIKEEDASLAKPSSSQTNEATCDSVRENVPTVIAKGSGEDSVADNFDGENRTYHVTSVAYRYSRPSGSLDRSPSGKRGEGPSKQEDRARNHSEPGMHSTPVPGTGSNGSVQPKGKLRAFSENEATSLANLSGRDLFSDDEGEEERLREARQLFISEDFRIRCSGCRRLICEKLLMTVADTELFWHNACFYCAVCGVLLMKHSDEDDLVQVRLIEKDLHCTTCFSHDGEQLSVV